MKITIFLALFALVLAASFQADAHVNVIENQLVVDGVKQPQLFGAELQYFRLRGGYGPNVPREKVIALWNKALDRLVAAKMNAVSFYIPWDFHEYAEGKFDFDGTADLDHDGKPDYPSRDVKTFFKLIAEHGITRVMVRPGPYINAEWGFLGFGAIPPWFHQKFPESHMRTPSGQMSKLYDYHNPDLLKYTERWFAELKKQVLDDQMGPGLPVIFLQLDNETNFQWSSIYRHDYGAPAIARYREFLKSLYVDVAAYNRAHGRAITGFDQAQAPTSPGGNVKDDQDWYQFADYSIYTYLHKVRQIWEHLGIYEPQVMFSLAESYNATGSGLLPNFVYRNARDITGIMTVNLYPKTWNEPQKALLNNPFKADLDVKSADEASDSYLGSRQEWVMGPEIQAGWWRGIEVSPEARQQTYLSVIGHGLKAFFVYYFNEGENWDVDWAFEKIKPLSDELQRERRLTGVSVNSLPDDFWNELQKRADQKVLAGFDVRNIIKTSANQDRELFFDAPLDGEANPRNHYFQLQKIGELVVAPYKDFLARSLELTDAAAFVKDSTSHAPVADANNTPAVNAEAEWSGGLLGYMLNADINPKILHGDISPEASFNDAMLVHLDTGLNAERTYKVLNQALASGKTVVNFLVDAVAKKLGSKVQGSVLWDRWGTADVTYYLSPQGKLVPAGSPAARAVTMKVNNPVYQYNLGGAGCEAILYYQNTVVGYRCGKLIQVGALVFEDFNSGAYGRMPSLNERKGFLKALALEAGVRPQLQLSSTALQTVAFGRKDPRKEILWITVKTGATVNQTFNLKVSAETLKNNLKASASYKVTDLLGAGSQVLTGEQLSATGFAVALSPHGSTVFVVQPVSR